MHTEKLSQEGYIAGAQEELKQLIRDLCAVPAPSNHEEKRAEFCKRWFDENLGSGAFVDEALNVVFPYNVTEDNDVAVLMAHTDTVFPDTEPMPFSEEGGIMRCPGITDDTANLANKVPLLDEVLELFEGKAPLIIELKTYGGNHRALAEAVCKRLDTYEGDFCIESFDPRAIAEVRRLRPWICRGQLAQDFIKRSEDLPAYQRVLLTTLRMNFLSRPDFIAYRFEDRHHIFLRLCVRSGVQEVNWTIDSKEDMLAAEADGALVIFERFDPDE